MLAALSPFLVPLLQLMIAMVLGMLLGMERSIVGKSAGMRTFALVSIGSCLLILVSETVARQWIGITTFDPLRLAAGIVTGVGFLGAGMIIYQHELKGLTTAASIWVASGIGIAVGYQLYAIAIATAVITLFVLTVLWHIERYVAGRVHFPSRKEQVTMEDEIVDQRRL